MNSNDQTMYTGLASSQPVQPELQNIKAAEVTDDSKKKLMGLVAGGAGIGLLTGGIAAFAVEQANAQDVAGELTEGIADAHQNIQDAAVEPAAAPAPAQDPQPQTVHVVHETHIIHHEHIDVDGPKVDELPVHEAQTGGEYWQAEDGSVAYVVLDTDTGVFYFDYNLDGKFDQAGYIDSEGQAQWVLLPGADDIQYDGGGNIVMVARMDTNVPVLDITTGEYKDMDGVVDLNEDLTLADDTSIDENSTDDEEVSDDVTADNDKPEVEGTDEVDGTDEPSGSDSDYLAENDDNVEVVSADDNDVLVAENEPTIAEDEVDVYPSTDDYLADTTTDVEISDDDYLADSTTDVESTDEEYSDLAYDETLSAEDDGLYDNGLDVDMSSVG